MTGKEERKHKIKSKEGMVVIKSGKRDIMVQDYMVQKKRARWQSKTKKFQEDEKTEFFEAASKSAKKKKRSTKNAKEKNEKETKVKEK